MGPVLLLLPAALAFQPQDGVVIGVEPSRLRRYHVERQHALRHGEAWTSFLDGEGAGWSARFDERTGTARRAWGPPIPLGLGAGASRDEVVGAIEAFLARNEPLIGVDAATLRPGRAVAAGGAWIVDFVQVVPGGSAPAVVGDDADGVIGELARLGAPVVWKGGVKARVVDGRLVLLGVDTYPGAAGAEVAAELTASEAVERARSQGPEPLAAHTLDGAVLVVLPVETGDGTLDSRLCWLVRTRTAEPGRPPGKWVSFVDAATGELVNVHNHVRFLSGTVYGLHDTRTVDGNTSTSAVPYAVIASDSDSDYTDAAGAFSLSGTGLVTALDGTHVRVLNDSGGEGSMSWTNGDSTWTTTYASQAEIDSYLFLHDVWEWAGTYASDLSIYTSRMTSHVNVNSSCNAYYDGNVNFYKEGSGCNNTGRIADVNYHEWGHGLHYTAAETGWIDSTVSEGAGDIASFVQTGDSEIAPYFYTSGGAIRDVAPDRVYPDDWVGESHYDGLIWAGAMWDLWAELLADLSAADAHAELSEMFVGALRDNPDTEGTYDAVLAADDDNGDLSDGTPNQCAILAAFAAHGLGPSGSADLTTISHEPLENQAASAPEYAVEADLVNLAPECNEVSVASARVVYSVDGGENWESAELDDDGETVSGAIPKQAPGSIVHYYLAVEDGDASEYTAPAGGDINPFSFVVGDLVELYCEDFEKSEAGYTHELIDGEDREGADDWKWGRPIGLAGDPDFAYSGVRLWGNDLGGGNYNGEYQASIHNRLTSTAIDVSGYDEVIVQFRRWLTVEDGFYDQARVLANGDEVWENHATSRNIGDEHHVDEQWALASIAVDMGGEGELTLAWEIESDQGLSKGGWNIDDVCVYALASGQDTGEPVDTGDTADTGTPDDSEGETGGEPDSGASVDEGAKDVELTACSCGTGGRAGGGALLALVGLAAAAGGRRRR